MSIRSLSHRSTRLLLLFPLLSPACQDDHALATVAEIQAGARRPETQALKVEKIVGGGGVNLAVYEGGNAGGPPIVFIQGFTGSHLTWHHQFSGPLAADFRLVTWEFRGHGSSDKPLDPAQYTDATLWADDLDAVIRAKNLDRPVLVGWSYAGYVIADYLRRFPDSPIGGVVFIGAVTKQGPEAAGFFSDEVLALFPEILSPEVGKNIPGTRALTRMFANPLRGEDWENSYGSAMMVPPEVRLAMFSRVLDNDDVLAAIRVPTLVIQGSRDRLVRLSAAQHIARTVPHGELRVYEGVGHAPHLEASQRLDRELAEFVRAARTSGRQP